MNTLLVVIMLLFGKPNHPVIDLINHSQIRYKTVAIAQAMHESGNFKSKISRYKHNHFGFKNKYDRYKRYKSDSFAVVDYEQWSNRFIIKHHIKSKTQFMNALDGRYADRQKPSYSTRIKRIENKIKI